MGHHDVVVVGQGGDRLVDHLDVVEPCLLDLAAQDRGAHGGRTHAGVAREHDVVDRLVLATGLTGQGGRGQRLLALHALHGCGGVHQVAVLGPVHLQQERPDQEGHQRGTEHTHRDPEEVTTRRLCVDRDDRARGCRSAQPDVEEHQQEHAGHATGDRGEDHLGLHQHVREVDLVDAAEELDDQRSRCRGLGQALAEERVGEQQARAGAGVGLEQEQHRLALLCGLLDAERRQHAVVDGVVEEEHLRRFDEDRGQWQQAVVDQRSRPPSRASR